MEHCTFAMESDSELAWGTIEARDIMTWMLGLSRFMKEYGYVEVDMDLVGVPPERRNPDPEGRWGFSGTFRRAEEQSRSES